MAEQSKRYDAHGVARQFVVVVGAVTLLLLVACSNDKASDSGSLDGSVGAEPVAVADDSQDAATAQGSSSTLAGGWEFRVEDATGTHLVNLALDIDIDAQLEAAGDLARLVVTVDDRSILEIDGAPASGSQREQMRLWFPQMRSLSAVENTAGLEVGVCARAFFPWEDELSASTGAFCSVTSGAGTSADALETASAQELADLLGGGNVVGLGWGPDLFAGKCLVVLRPDGTASQVENADCAVYSESGVPLTTTSTSGESEEGSDAAASDVACPADGVVEAQFQPLLVVGADQFGSTPGGYGCLYTLEDPDGLAYAVAAMSYDPAGSFASTDGPVPGSDQCAVGTTTLSVSVQTDGSIDSCTAAVALLQQMP